MVPICQGPSISLPRHQYLTSCGCSKPCDRRRSLHFVPRSTLQYSTRATCSATVPVPKLPPSNGSLPTSFIHWMNSFVPNWLDSSVFQARSSTVGRWFFGPTPSSQLYPETKLPPGYRMIGTPSPFTSAATSLRKPLASARGDFGS